MKTFLRAACLAPFFVGAVARETVRRKDRSDVAIEGNCPSHRGPEAKEGNEREKDGAEHWRGAK